MARPIKLGDVVRYRGAEWLVAGREVHLERSWLLLQTEDGNELAGEQGSLFGEGSEG